VLQLEKSVPNYLPIKYFLILDARNSFPLIMVATKSLPPSLLINMRDVIQNLLNLRSIEIVLN